MIHVTCMRCGRTHALTNEQIVRAVEESRGTKRKHYVVDCPYCRHAIKVPLRPIRQAYTRMEALGLLPERPAPAEQAEEQPTVASDDQPGEEEAAEERPREDDG